MRKPAPRQHGKQHGDRHESSRAELFSNRREDRVGVAGRKIAGIAEAEPGPQQSARRHRPQRVSDLIAAGNRVVPGRLPHPHAIGERGRHFRR